MSIFQQTKLLKIKKLIKLLNYIFLILFFNSFFSKTVFCEIKNFNISLNDINDIVNNEVRESFSYSGLASYYNKVETYIISNKKIERIENDNFYNLNSIQTLAIVGHHKILIINNLNISVLFKKGKIIFQEINSKKKKLN